MAAVGSSGNVYGIWSLDEPHEPESLASKPREQAFWNFLLPAVPGIIEALPAKCAVLLHLEPATIWICKGAKM